MYMAGFNGELIIRSNFADLQWDMFKVNSPSEKQHLIGFIKTENASPWGDLTSILGSHVMNCYITGENESVAELFKFTNVS